MRYVNSTKINENKTDVCIWKKNVETVFIAFYVTVIFGFRDLIEIVSSHFGDYIISGIIMKRQNAYRPELLCWTFGWDDTRMKYYEESFQMTPFFML